MTTSVIILSIFTIGKAASASEVTGDLSTGINSTMGNTVSGVVITPPSSSGGSSGGGGGASVTPVTVTPAPVVVAPVATPLPQTNTIVPQVLGEQMVNVTALEQSLTTKIDAALTRRLAGRILLQVESHGEAWYLDPIGLKKYYLADGSSAYTALRTFGLGITNTDLAKIPIGEEVSTNGANSSNINSVKSSSALVNRLKGRILLQVQSHGEAWYVNPVDGKRYYMANGDAAYQIMRYLSLGITNTNLRKISVGDIEAIKK